MTANATETGLSGTIQYLREYIYQAIGELGWGSHIVLEDLGIEHPKVETHGDYSTNVALVLSKKIGKKPIEIAERINECLVINVRFNEIFDYLEVAGPGFINVKLKTNYLIKEIERVINESDKFGSASIGHGKTVIVEYSSPNIAKAFGIGHLRSTIIGQALYNIYRYLGFNVIGDNHIGDWGTQFGKLLYMIDTKGDGNLTLEKLEQFYVEFHEIEKENPKIAEAARGWFKKLETGDARARELWKKCIDISMREFNRIYEMLGVKIDNAYGESYYEDIMADVVKDAREKGIAIESDGATVIEVPGIKTPLMLLKSDGATTYATRDLATVKFRQEKWNPSMVIYEVGVEQTLHFQQVFGAARLLGYVTDSAILIHTKHGLYLAPDGKKFATREGKTVRLKEVLEEAIEKAKSLGSEESARDVGIGAIKYFDLKHSVQSDIVFEWEKVLSLDGDSGPYIQYTHARTQSVLEKGSSLNDQSSKSKLNLELKLNEEELAVLRWIYRFPEVIAESAQLFAPNILANYLFDLSQRFNTFYNKHSILGKSEDGVNSLDNETREFRIAMTGAVGQVIKNGLGLLGIAAPNKM